MYATWERIESSSHDHTSNMIDRDSVDSVDNAWPGRQLNAALQHTDQEVIGIADTSLRVA
jgi:hypothetical protein